MSTHCQQKGVRSVSGAPAVVRLPGSRQANREKEYETH